MINTALYNMKIQPRAKWRPSLIPDLDPPEKLDRLTRSERVHFKSSTSILCFDIHSVLKKKKQPKCFLDEHDSSHYQNFFFFFWRLCQGYRQTVSWRKGELSQVSAGERSSPSYLVNSIINTVIQLKPLGVSRNENWCSYSAQWASQVGPN